MVPDPLCSTPQALLREARSRPEALAVTEGGRDVHYRGFAELVLRCARALVVSGVQRGTFVGIHAQDRILGLALIVACEVVGAVSVPLTVSDLVGDPFVIRQLGFLCSDTPAANAAAGHGRLPLDADALGRIAALPVHDGDLDGLNVAPPPQQMTKIARTSGTTGRPKLIPVSAALTDRQITRSASERTIAGYTLGFTGLYNFVPHWVYVESAMALRAGRSVAYTSFDHLPAVMERFPGGTMSLHAGDVAMLIAAFPAQRRTPWHCLLNVKGGGISPGQRQTLQSRIVTGLHHSYGITETFRVSVIDDDGVGHLCADAQARIIGPDGQTLPFGQPGVIEVRTPSMADRYLGDPEATVARFVAGWYRTTDLGLMPSPGRLVLLGRADDMLNVGGIKIAPEPLEQRIGAIPGVREAALLMLPDADGGDVLTVALALAEAADPDSVLHHVAPLLLAHTPRFAARRVAALPRTPTGKLRRAALRDMLSTASG